MFDVDARSVVVLTHVCRYWRESIISTPGNWTLVSSGDKDLMALSLERSKPVPLKLYLRMDEIRTIPEFSDLIMPYTRNTKTLRVEAILSVEEFMQKLPNFPQSMPNLWSLELSKDTTGERGQSTDPFGSFAPTLGALKLIAFPLYPSLLHFRALTELALFNGQFDLHLDILLNFLEENRSLESVILSIRFTKPSLTLRSSQRPAAIGNRVRYLLIDYWDVMDGKALISNMTLPRGVQLEIVCCDKNTGLNDLLPGISTTQLPGLSSPTSVDYEPRQRVIRLLGPNGSFSFGKSTGSQDPFIEFSLLPLANVRKFHLIHHAPPLVQTPITPVFHPSFLPALEIFTLDCDASVSQLLSILLLNPSSLPSLKTLAFSNCRLSTDFMEALTRFASNRKNTTSTWLRRVVIVNPSSQNLPGVPAIEALRKHVPFVDVSVGRRLPVDLVWKAPGRFPNLPISLHWYGRV